MTILAFIFWGVIFLAALIIAWPLIVVSLAVTVALLALVIALMLILWVGPQLFEILSAVLPALTVLLLVGGVIWSSYRAVVHRRALLDWFHNQAHERLTWVAEKGRGAANPKEWSATGACALAMWLFMVTIATVVLGVPILTTLGEEQSPWSMAWAVGIAGLLGLSALFCACGVIWHTFDWLCTPKKELSGYAKFAFFAGCVLLGVGQTYRVVPSAALLVPVGLLMWMAALVLMATGDLRRRDRGDPGKAPAGWAAAGFPNTESKG